MKTTIGGDRIGSGNKQEVSLKNYSRSTHDLSYLWRTTMSSGTLVPFMSELALPGDSWDIDLNCDIKTMPTVGPLFGSYKVQLDVFECPVRLYQGKLHMNMLNIGMDMSEIKLPQMDMVAYYDPAEENDNAQVNPSSIYSYLNVRGLGRRVNSAGEAVRGNIERSFNAIPYLGYWDIYKNYYANKQETDGVVIHQEDLSNEWEIQAVQWIEPDGTEHNIGIDATIPGTPANIDLMNAYIQGATVQVLCLYNNPGEVEGSIKTSELTISLGTSEYKMEDAFENVEILGAEPTVKVVRFTQYTGVGGLDANETVKNEQDYVENTIPRGYGKPQLTKFPLANIDEMREEILKAVQDTTAFKIDGTSNAPYGLGLNTENGLAAEDYENAYCKASQEGLACKTYQSDLFNNWIETDWIDGTNGVAELSAVLVTTQGTDQVVRMDALNLSQKVYNMLNRIAVSGGSYDDWLDAVYTHERAKSIESPVYHGSLIKSLGFEEVVSNSDTIVKNGVDQPLGSLAGRGKLSGKHKGGKIKIKVSEPSYLIGLVSLTPLPDTSQGNKWDMRLKTMNDFHKPALDEIGYEDLITDQMAWFDTTIEPGAAEELKFNSAGKQPAWINYMTNVNQCKGNFAIKDNSMFMTLNRRYEQSDEGITDLTTYIDPSKFNNIFAEQQLDSQNFWCQIANNITCRRKMSAKVIPNL